MKEIWKQSRLVETIDVSDLGRVRNSMVNPPIAQKAGKIRYLHVHKSGYLYLPYKKSGKQKSIKVHRLVANEFVENVDNLPCVNHKDGDKANNSATNLEWCTHLENMKHAFSLGLVPAMVGEKNGRALINEDLVHKICKDYENGLKPKQVMEKYSVTRNQAMKIKSKLTWKHITSQYKY